MDKFIVLAPVFVYTKSVRAETTPLVAPVTGAHEPHAPTYLSAAAGEVAVVPAAALAVTVISATEVPLVKVIFFTQGAAVNAIS